MSCARKLINNVLVVILFLPALLAAHETSAEELGALVSHRLGYMKAVAAYKWLNQLPIENQAREQLVLSSNSGRCAATNQRITMIRKNAAQYSQVHTGAKAETTLVLECPLSSMV